MKDLTIGVHIMARDAAVLVEGIAAAEQAGVDVAWQTCGGVAPDALAVFAAAAMRTSRIRFGTCIMPTFPRHPLALVQSAIAVNSLAPGRLRLGVGPSHKPTVESTYNIPFERPLQHLREYVTILNTIFETGKVDFDGKRLTAHAQIPGPAPVEVLASALRANGFRLAGEMTAGGISWMCPLPYLRDVAAPALREGAARAGRPAPALIAHVPVVVSEDAEAVRAAAKRLVGFYPSIPYYSQMLQDAGFPEAAQGEFSDRMVDYIVISGGAEHVKARIREMPSFGAAELLASPLTVPGDPDAAARTVRVLGELAQES